jgi:hypothetical protein
MLLGGEFLLKLVAELFGTEARGTARVERNVGFEVREESRVIALREVNVGEKPVDDGNTRREKPGLFGRSESIGKTLLQHEGAAEFVVTEPKIGIELKPLANGFFGVGDIAGIKKNGAEADMSFRIFVPAKLKSFAERRFRFGAIAERELGHGELIFRFVIGESERDSLLKIG